MTPFRVEASAALRLEEIYRYTCDLWGPEQAEEYIEGMFRTFASIQSGSAVSRPIPGEFGVRGYWVRYHRHFIYWRQLTNGDVGIVTVLHEAMHRIDRLQGDFGI